MTATLAGIIAGLDEAEYHAHPALSSTGARLLLDSPARFRYRQTHPEAPRTEFDIGSAAHAKVLGVGAPIVAIPDELLASNGAISTVAAKAFVAEARAQGQIALKAAVVANVNAMSEAVLAQPTARAFIERAGIAEASVFATDPATGVQLRARFDFLPQQSKHQTVTVDLKSTAKAASPAQFARTVADHGYEVQEGHYLDTYGLVTGDTDAAMVFVAVEKTPPYLVSVNQLNLEFREMGRVKARKAREIFRECTDTDTWPGYDIGVQIIQPPMYSVYDFQDRFDNE